MKIPIWICIIFLQSSFFLFSQDFLGESLSREIEDFILNEYVIFDSNPVHIDVNNVIQENFFYLLENYESYDQNTLDKKAMEIFQIIYSEIHFGLLEDSADLRRQSQRAAFCYSSIALCSNNDYSYYLDLASYTLFPQKAVNDALLNEFYCTQILVNLYILNLKSSMSGILSSIEHFNDVYENLRFHSDRIERVKSIVEKISEGLPPDNR